LIILGFSTHRQNGKRLDPRSFNDNVRNANNFRFPATAPLSSETHGAEDVGVWVNKHLKYF
jgi:hypothetical protein